MPAYFRIAFRHLWKSKLFSVINILGLALGLACCFIIILHVKFETGFDRFHANKDRIVRVLNGRFAWTPLIMATVMPDYFPEIEKIARVGKLDWTRFYISKNNDWVEDKNLVYTDSTFFTIFSFRILTGVPEKILRSPDRIMISESMARKYYGTENVMGKNLTMRIMNRTYQFTVEGVFYDIPEQSHFHASFLTSMEFCRKLYGEQEFENWGANSVHTYLLMKQPESISSIQDRMPGFINKFVDKSFTKDLQYNLQPLTRIHLYSKESDMDIEPQGSISRIIVFTSIAVLILIIAVVNFVLLSLALSNQRIKEFGIRKIVGARQRELVSLVSAEFLIVFVLGVQIALMLVELTIPVLKSRMNIQIYHGVFANTGILLLFLAVVFILGYLASVYITLHVSRISPIEAMRNALPRVNRWVPSRSILVVFQFSIMTGLLVCLMIMQKQLWLIRHKDLGFRKEMLLTIDIPDNAGSRYQVFKEELMSMRGVEKVSGAAYVPPSGQLWTTRMKNPETGESFVPEEINGDYDLVETLGLQIIQGRSFSRDYGNDSMAIMINETGLKQLRFKNPLDSYLVRDEQDQSREKKAIIGVFKDFHVRSLYEKIQPMVIFLSPRMVHQMAIRLSPGDNRPVLKQIEKKWNLDFPDDPFQFSFVDEALHLSYLKDDQAHDLISLFAFLSFIIALMGLFGLSAFAVERRTKETGIRKVNGARASDIFYVLSRQFTVWIMIAFIFATPASWFAMHRWLQHFAYRTGISWWIFVLALLISVLVASLTICWQTYRAATRNPVEALRYE
jgi:putative ABC transport system permease protein